MAASDYEHEKSRPNTRPFLDLLQKLGDASLTAADFKSCYINLWISEHNRIAGTTSVKPQGASGGQSRDREIESIIDRIHFMAYHYDPDVDADPDLHVDEGQLRTEAMRALERLQRLQNQT